MDGGKELKKKKKKKIGKTLCTIAKHVWYIDDEWPVPPRIAEEFQKSIGGGHCSQLVFFFAHFIYYISLAHFCVIFLLLIYHYCCT